MSRFDLTEEVRAKYIPVIRKFFDEITSKTTEDLEAMEDEAFVLPLSDTELNPYTLQKILKRILGTKMIARILTVGRLIFGLSYLKTM